jgi:hypothetical protein
MSYSMTAPEQAVWVLHNLSAAPQAVLLDGSGTVLFVTYDEGFASNEGSIVLPSKCSVVIEKSF